MRSHILQKVNGKIERCFRTVKDEFFNLLDWNSISSLEQVQNMYTEFLESSYINKIHSAIKSTPKERFMKDFSNIKRKTDEQIEEAFLHRETRNVRYDATISFRDILYEVPQEYIKKKVIIKFNPSNINELYIYSDKNERMCSITPINKVDNSRMKRAEKVSMYRGE